MNVEQFDKAFDYFLSVDDNKLIVGLTNGTKLIIHAIENDQSNEHMIVGYNMDRYSTSFIPLANIVSLTTEYDVESSQVKDKLTAFPKGKEDDEEQPVHESPEDTDSE